MSNLPMPDPVILESLKQAGLISAPGEAHFEPLAGGVASDIWRVETSGEVFCVKKALSKLKVAADWYAPVERNRFEVSWCRIASELVPGAAPRILLHDEVAQLCAMEFLEPGEHRLWKTELQQGRVDLSQAALVGERLARIHSGTSGENMPNEQFPQNDIFHAIRLEPYLEATAQRHPDLAEALFGLSRRTGATRLAMIHGDVSPKNILMGPDGPVFLDAECACIGDPAFDLAFCLKHLLLKCLWTPAAREQFLEVYHVLVTAYLEKVDWEPVEALEQRTASLLPGLFLARVDGKSPVEYLQSDAGRGRVRRCARRLLLQAPDNLQQVAESWREELES